MLHLEEIHQKLFEGRGVDVCIPTISRALRDLLITNKKVSYHALQRNELLRATWIGEYGDIPKEYIVWLDESGVDGQDYQRTHGWSELGLACVSRTTFLRGERFSMLPAVTCGGIIALDIFQGTLNRERFIQYLKEDLVCSIFQCFAVMLPIIVLQSPVLKPYPGPQSVVMLDNCAIHHDEEICVIIEDECGMYLSCLVANGYPFLC